MRVCLTKKVWRSINIECSLGEVNSIHLEKCNKIVEIYLSPNFNRANIPLVEYLYDCRIPLSNCNVVKYRAWNKNSDLIEEIYFPIGEKNNEKKKLNIMVV